MQVQELKSLWEDLEPLVNAEITKRILLFHDALIERGQIRNAPLAGSPTPENNPDPDSDLVIARRGILSQ